MASSTRAEPARSSQDTAAEGRPDRTMIVVDRGIGDDYVVFHFAHPAYCPDCRTARQPGGERCQRCGLVVVGAQANRLYGLLADADATLERLRETSRGPVTGPVSPSVAPPVPEPAALRTPSRVTTGSVLLALGALLLVVAATVFVAVAWGSLSLTARTVLLIGMTGVGGVSSLVCVRRRLRASAEALWAMTTLLLLVDLAAAQAADLAGAGALGGQGVLTSAALLLGLPSAAAALFARQVWADGAERLVLGTAEAAVIAAGVAAASALAYDWEQPDVWLALAVLTLLIVLVLVEHLLGLAVAARGSAGLAVLAYAVSGAFALEYLAERPELSDVASGSGWPAALLLVASAAAATGAPRAGPQVVAALAATGLASAICLAPAEAAGTEELSVVGALIVLVLAGLGAAPGRGWVDGVRIAAAAGVLALLGWLAGRASVAVERVAVVAEPVWATGADTFLPAGSGDGPAWLTVPVAAGVAGAAGLALLWSPSTPAAREPLLTLAALAVAGGAVVTVATAEIPVAVLTVAAVLAAVVAAWATRMSAVLPAVAVVLAGALASLGSAGLSSVALGATAGALLARASRRTATPEVPLLAATGFVVADVAVLAAAHALGATGDLAPVVVVTAGTVVATMLAGWLAAMDHGWAGVGLGAELAGGAGLVVAVGLAAPVGPGTLAVTLTVLGGVAVVVGLLRSDRAPVRWLGVVLLQVAWTVRLVDTEVDVVEVYTLPAGVLLTAAGLWTLLRGPQAGTRTGSAATLLPGLGLAVLPSLPQAMLEPTSVRGWLAGAAGIVLVAAAVGLRWFAPMLVGGVSVTLLALAHLVSAAQAVPRWVTLAAVGATLLGAGITWENRVRQARALASYVEDLR